MPELPEVETTGRGIRPHLLGATVAKVTVRQPQLRWPVSPALSQNLPGHAIEAIHRRGKYLLLSAADGFAMVHLGMSGSLRVVADGDPPGKHDHLDLVCGGGKTLRYNDPRRFGAWLWVEDPPRHKLLRHLGPEPVATELLWPDAPRLEPGKMYQTARGRKTAVKNFLMDGRVVVGVGNIYASEALYRAGIDPRRAAGRVSKERYGKLVDAVVATLSEAIKAGGTTLRDFHVDKRPGYFRQQLAVYGRAGEPCPGCGTEIRRQRIGQRMTYFCHQCQR